MKQILITQRLVAHDAYEETRACLDIAWGSYLSKLGLLPIPALPTTPVEELFSGANFGGVILSSGNDLASQTGLAVDRQRDEFESALLTHSLEKGLPVLGICRGAQFIAEKYSLEIRPCQGHVVSSHELDWAQSPSCLKDSHLPKGVNSFHTYSIHGESKDVTVLARAGDGGIEAFEIQDKPVLALMWHPERESPSAAFDEELIRSFFSL